jgi:type III secretion regulatory protein HpaA
MKVDGTGPNALQLLQLQADIEAANRPTPGLAAAHRNLAGRRAGIGHSASDDAAQQDIVYTPLHHLRLAALQNKLRMRRARGAAGADAADSASEFEELLLLLESQAQTQAQTSALPQIRVGRRRQERQPDQHPDARPQSPWPRAADERPAPTLRERQQQALDRLVRDHAGGTVDGAMRALHTLQSDPAQAVPLATAVLRVTREYLAQPAATAPAKLADVKARLLALLPPPSSRAAPSLRQLHLLLPILLLNAQRPRTSRQRALALAKVDVLLRGAQR